MDGLLSELQKLAITLVSAAGTALCGYVFVWLRTKLGIEESDSNEKEIRNAAVTEAGKLISEGKIADPQAVLNAAAKIVADLHPAVVDEGYSTNDIKDMIIGAAGIVFPPANLLKMLIK
jgi:hypothetical protein